MAFALFLRNVDSILHKNEREGEYNSFEYKTINTKSLSLRLFASVVSESVNTLGDNTGISRHSTTVLLLRTRIRMGSLPHLRILWSGAPETLPFFKKNFLVKLVSSLRK